MRSWMCLIIGCAVGLVAAPVLAADSGMQIERAEARFVPWSGYWWPLRAGGLNGPLARYDQVTGANALAWQKEHRPTDPDAPRWHGYCHAWAASCVMEPEPIEPVRVTAHQDNTSLTLSIGDQKGMLAACHTHNVANVYGRRTEEGDEPDGDLAPDVLWRLLKLYLDQQGVPLVLDIEPGPEVWNHPVYAYEIRYTSPDETGLCQARLTLWLADDAVPPDYIGTKVRKQNYTFEFRMHGGSVVLGSGQWTGRSRQDHPDFAWYPFVARAENPEVQHQVVQQLVSRAPREPESPEPTLPEPAPPEPTLPEPDELMPPLVLDEDPAPVLLSPIELVALVTNKTSSFGLDVTVDRFDGAHYHPGETFSIRGSSEQAGYLYLLHIDSVGDLTLLYPLAGQDNRVAAEKPFQLPADADRFAYRVTPPPGMNRVKAVVTSRPLALTGLLAVARTGAPIQQSPVQQSPVQLSAVQQSPMPVQRELQEPGPAGQVRPGMQAESLPRQSFRWHPSQRRQIRQLLLGYQQRARLEPGQLAADDPLELLGEFSQDEVAFYVEPEPAPEPPVDSSIQPFHDSDPS